MIDACKVVTAQEMARVEKSALQRGASEERFIEEAGRKVAAAAMALVKREKLPQKALLLVGKGNNGADAYAAGLCLLNAGFQVRAFRLSEGGTPHNRQWAERFQKRLGKVEDELTFEEGLVIDGFLGTGFKGQVEEKMAAAIRAVNGSGLPILAIDIPSGLNGSTGEVGSVAIRATETVTLGLPKMGFFLREGWNHVGKLQVADFGLPAEAVAEAEAIAYMPMGFSLPPIVRNRHKYQAGYVVGFGGSKVFSGAAKLSGLSALRAGAGIVRLFHPEEIGSAPYELICNQWNAKDWKEALGKAQAVFVGPGLGKSKKAHGLLKKHLKGIRQRCVLDADALMPGLPIPQQAVLTPHRGEALRLLGLKAMPSEEELFIQVLRFCDRHQCTVVLKGAPTFVFGSKKKPVVICRGDPGMATAGAGDVLTGMIAGLLAQGCSPYEGAIAGTLWHGMAGEEAAQAKTSYCLLASDLIDFIPKALRQM
jgi:NAD(P)H-hydrate epimerase